MMGWKEYRIAEIGKVITGKTPPTADSAYFRDGQHLFVSPKDMKHDGFHVTNTTTKVTDKAMEKFKNQVLPPGSILYTSLSYGFGKIGITNEKVLTNQQINSIIVKKGFNKEFIFYLLRSSTPYIFSFNSGIDTPIVPKSVFEKLKLPVPPLSVQRKIAAVLSAYDDLIENNNRRIAILEKMAEEIYREWFVRMRFPGHEKAKFHKGVPEGWDVVRLGRVLELAYGKALKEEDRAGGKFPVFGSSGIVGYHDKYLAPGPGIVVGRKGNVGSVFWSPDNFYPIDTAFFVRASASLYYLFFSLQTLNFINADAAVPGLNRSQAYSNIVFMPDASILRRFDEVVRRLFATETRLKAKNEKLGKSRDLLLSRLMTGKLSVDDLDIKFPPSMGGPELAEEKEADG